MCKFCSSTELGSISCLSWADKARPCGEGDLCLGLKGGVRVYQAEELGRAFETEGTACTKTESQCVRAVANSLCHIL